MKEIDHERTKLEAARNEIATAIARLEFERDEVQKLILDPSKGDAERARLNAGWITHQLTTELKKIA